MNGRARTLAAIRGQPVDRVPVGQQNFLFAARYAGLTVREYRSSPEKAARALADTAYDFGLDCIMPDFDTCVLAEAMGAEVAFPPDEPARVVAPAVSSLAAISELRLPEPKTDGRLPVSLETVRLLRAMVGDELAILGPADQGPFGLAFLLEDSTQFLMDLLEVEPSVITAAIDRCMQAGVLFARDLLDAGADFASFGDSAAGQSVVSPAIYRRFAQPAEADYRRRLDAPILSLHICGRTAEIIDDMVATGCEVLQLDHFNDLMLTFLRIRGRASVFGNLDTSVLALRSHDDVFEASRRAIEAAAATGARFVLCSGCTVGALTPAENLRAMVRAAKDSGGSRRPFARDLAGPAATTSRESS